MRRLFLRMPARVFFCGLWLAVTLLLFLFCAGQDLSLLFARPPAKSAPRGVASLAVPVPASVPTLEDLFPAPVQAQHPAHIPTLQQPGTVAPGGFSLNKEDLTAAFTLNKPVTQSSVRFQKNPAAWMVEIPGVWRREGKEQYDFKHGVVRRIRLLPMKDAMQFKFYYTDRRTAGTRAPTVTMESGRVLIKVENP